MTKLQSVTAETLSIWLDNDQAILIDVREDFEYKESHIKKAINVPLSELLTKIYEINGIKTKKIVLQCRIGRRSVTAYYLLKDDHFEGDIWNLEGGIDAWGKCGLPLIS